MAMRQRVTRSKSMRSAAKSAGAAGSSAPSQPPSRSGSAATSSGEPANADTLAYGELPGPTGVSGSVCHRLCRPDASQSMKCNADGPKSPLPCGPGSEVGCSSTPASRR